MSEISRLFPVRLFLFGTLLGGAVLHCGGGDTPGSPITTPDIPGGGCDASKPLDQGGCDVSDARGIFVAPTGADTNPGTKAAPLRTVQAGIDKAKADPERRDVYVCTGVYEEQISLDGTAQGVALHGGFQCADWSYAATTVSLAPTKPGYVAKITGSASVIETFELHAKDADTPGASSIAVYVEAAPGMTFRRVKLFAGKGAAGADGSPGDAWSTAAQKGADPAGAKAATATSCTCSTGSTTGGGGGGGTAPVPNPSAGTPTIAGAAANAGTPYPLGPSSPCNPIGSASAFDGAIGLAADVVKGAGGIGALSSNGWAPTRGQDGLEGGVGQGGGGGSGRPDQEVGGGGGCGGCGGRGGKGGGGGGASIGIASLNGTVRIQSSTITTGDGGDGGKGGDGSAGQAGGAGGIGNFAIFPYCAGGAGGKGGAGGGGGGGAGGSSIGVISVGTKQLELDKATIFTIGAAKSGGAGGGPKGATGGSGIDGLAIQYLGPKSP